MTFSRRVETIHTALKWEESTPAQNNTDDEVAVVM